MDKKYSQDSGGKVTHNSFILIMESLFFSVKNFRLRILLEEMENRGFSVEKNDGKKRKKGTMPSILGKKNDFLFINWAFPKKNVLL